jgi:hypothetical protein
LLASQAVNSVKRPKEKCVYGRNWLNVSSPEPDERRSQAVTRTVPAKEDTMKAKLFRVGITLGSLLVVAYVLGAGKKW